MRAIVTVIFIFLCGQTLADSPEDREMSTYREYLSSEVHAGRMTNEQARYLIVRKQNEMTDRNEALMRQGIDMMNSANTPQRNYGIRCTTESGVTTCR